MALLHFSPGTAVISLLEYVAFVRCWLTDIFKNLIHAKVGDVQGYRFCVTWKGVAKGKFLFVLGLFATDI